jgi:putative PEP-CTERM system histidine kinase
MLITFLYVLNGLLLLSGILIFRLPSGERRFSLSLLRVLVGLPLLAGEYLYLFRCPELQAVRLLFFSEVVFACLWIVLALRLSAVTTGSVRTGKNILAEFFIDAMVFAGALYLLFCQPLVGMNEGQLLFRLYSSVYFLTLFMLVAVLYAAWRLEQFWRALDSAQRWEYKLLVVGSYLVCGSLAWASSYRLTYLVILSGHLQLLGMLLFCGWILIAYAVVQHRLLNRKIFVSRKVVYSFVVPSLLAVYFLGFGALSLAMRLFGLEFSFLLKWLGIVLGLLAVTLFAFSGKLRRRVHFFISTHFYINKYEYRDEWLALSRQLQGAMTETEVVEALRQVLAESLYTDEIFIWLGSDTRGFRLVSVPGEFDTVAIAPDDPLVKFLRTHGHLYLQEKEMAPVRGQVLEKRGSFFRDLNLVLLFPLAIGERLLGMIGLGLEFTGGEYGHDDFDLLTALSSQAASALLAARMAEELVHVREQQAWNRLSAFVLHDIKNAATMLSLLRENVPEHIHEPEFQQDMLEVVDDALRRMGRVEERLQTLKDELAPAKSEFSLCRLLEDCRRKLNKKLSTMEITVECRDKFRLNSDPDFLVTIVENLLLNAFEAGGEGTSVKIETWRDETAGQAVLEVTDNGPGIAAELLPDLLFEPFKTSKAAGSGIGLWQVKKMVESLGGSIAAANIEEDGARFVVRLPL